MPTGQASTGTACVYEYRVRWRVGTSIRPRSLWLARGYRSGAGRRETAGGSDGRAMPNVLLERCESEYDDGRKTGWRLRANGWSLGSSAELERRVAADGARTQGRVFGCGLAQSRMAEKKGEYSFRAGEERMTGLRWGRWAETRMTQSINQVGGQDGGTLLRAALEPGGGRYGRVWEYDGRA